MEDQSLFNSSQPRNCISEGLQNFINAMVEEIVLEGKPFDTQKKYLKKFTENEGLDYEAIENGISELIETLGEMKSSDSKSLMKLALIQAKEACVTEAEVIRIVELMGKKEDGFQSAKQIALGGIIQSLQNRSAKVKLDDSTIDFNVNGVEFKMVKVEGGSFWMGAHKHYRKIGLFSKEPDNSIPNFDKEAWEDEEPPHIVTLSSFYMGETEVTQALWMAVMGDNPSYFHGDNHPVEQVSWNDCQVFIRKLNRLTEKNFRLPTEAEWEYAARGGQKNESYIYSGSNDAEEVAWVGSMTGPNMIHPVKMKRPNILGLYDMSGNVWEWCNDWYDSNYYRNSPSNNPMGPSSGMYRVARGGSWCLHKNDSRVSRRNDWESTERARSIGFRLAISV